MQLLVNSEAPRSQRPGRPPIHIIDTECDILGDLALKIERRSPEIAAMLFQELDRAEIHAADDLPSGIVTLGSTVEFVDAESGASRTLQLVLPHEADLDAGRLSVLTLVGAGLIGLAAGQSISWPVRDGHERELRIVRVDRP